MSDQVAGPSENATGRLFRQSGLAKADACRVDGAAYGIAVVQSTLGSAQKLDTLQVREGKNSVPSCMVPGTCESLLFCRY